MATRLYGVATTAAPVSPAFAGWVSTTGAVRRSLSTSKAAATETRATVSVTSGAGNNTLGFQLVSDPLTAQTISGTVTIVARWRELATSDNIQARVRSIRVVSNDGSTVRGTLLALGNHSVTTEPTVTTLAGFPFANATALSSVTCQDGDRIVVELGLGMTTTGTTPQYDMVIGGNGTDHATGEQDTSGTVPWVEFSANLTFQPVTTADLPEGTGTRSFTPVDTQAGDFLVVGIQVESGGTPGSWTPSGTGVTFGGSADADSGQVGSSRGRAIIWVGSDSAGGSRTVTITAVGTLNYRARVTVVHGATGVGGTGASSTAQTVSVTRTGNNSMMFMGVTDWSAGPVLTPVWTPGGATTASQQGSAATYIFGRWDDSGAAGTATHGISSPSYTTPAVVAVELLMTGGGPSTVNLAPGVLTLSGQPLTATPTVAWNPATVTLTGQPMAATPGVGLAPATLTLAGQPVTPTPQPVTVALVPSVLSLAGQPVTPTPRVALAPGTVTLTGQPLTPALGIALAPATLTLAGQPVTPTPRAALNAAVLTLTGQPVVALPTVALSAAVLTLTGQPMAPAAQPITAALASAVLTLAGQPLSPQASGFVALAPAVLALAGQPVVARPTVAAAAAVLTLSGRPLAPMPAVQFTAAALTLTGRPLSPAAQTVTAALAAAVLTLTGGQVTAAGPVTYGGLRMSGAAVTVTRPRSGTLAAVGIRAGTGGGPRIG